MISAAAYIRVSSEMQVDVGASLPSQLSAIMEFAERNGYEIRPEHVYSDEGVSARTADRPQFQAMVADAKTDPLPFKAVICYENSRFARSREDAVLFKSMFRRRGVKLHFVKQEFDDSPAGRMMEGIIESVDQWYSENLAVETKRGQIQNTKDGYSTGGRPPYGLKRIKVKNEHGGAKVKWGPDPEKSKIVCRIYDDYCNKKMGYKSIAQALNAESIPSPSGRLWNANTLHYILHKNQHAYLGCQIYGREKGNGAIGAGKYAPEEEWTINRNAWEPIITEEQASMASERSWGHRSGRRSRGGEEMSGKDVPRYLLTGKITCGECGSAMVGSTSSHNHYYYRCNKQALQGKAVCGVPLAGVLKVENTVIKAIKEHLANKEVFRNIYEEYVKSQKEDKPDSTQELINLKAALKRKEEERKNLVAAIVRKIITNNDAKDFMSQIDLDTKKLQARINELNFHKFPAKLTPNSFDDFANTIQIAVNLETKESRRILIDTFIDHVTVYPDHLHIALSVAIADKNETLCLGLAEGARSQPKTQFNFMIEVVMAGNQGRVCGEVSNLERGV